MATTQQKTVKKAQPGNREHEIEGVDTGQRKKVLRRRATIACEECRIRKRRCDGAAGSCGACLKRMTKCVYASDHEAREWSWSVIQTLRNQLDELENVGRSSQRFPEVHHSRAVPTSTDLCVPVGPSTLNRCADNFITAEQMDGVVLLQPTESPSHPDYSTSADGGAKTVSGRASLSQPRPLNEPTEPQTTSSIDTDQSLSLERMMKPINQMIDSTEQDARPTIIYDAASGPSSPRLGEARMADVDICRCDLLLSSRRQWVLPLRRHADSLIQRYFSRHNIAFPILHEPTFQRQYVQIWDSAPDVEGTDSVHCSGLCKQRSQGRLLLPTIYAVFALSSLFETTELEQNVMRANSFFRLAQEVDILEILDNEVGMELVQLLLLLGRYLQSTERFAKCKNVSGLAIRTAQDMGLQYSVAEAQKRGVLVCPITQLESEMRARVWYGCVLLERETPMYLSFGRSSNGAIGAKSFKLPAAIDDVRLSNDLERTGVQPKETPSLLEPYIQIIKLHDILAELLDRHEATLELSQSTASSIQLVLRLDTAITEWRDAMPSCLQFDLSESNGSQADSADKNRTSAGAPIFSKQAKTIYLRYLNARQLILRPALELVFRKQQTKHVSSTTEKAPTPRLEDVMLSSIAAECVVSALHIVEMLASPTRSHDCMAWWFNVAFLHTCGSTILMGKTCNFPDASFTTDSLAAGWGTCLKNLEGYTRLSSVARKSYSLLRQSAKRLVHIHQDPSQDHQKNVPSKTQQPTRTENYQQQPADRGARTSKAYDSQAHADFTRPPAQSSLETDNHDLVELSEGIGPGVVPFVDSDLHMGDFQDLDDNFWLGDSGTFNWSLMPSLPQSRALSPRFDF